MTRSEMEKAMVEKSVRDEAFRAALIADPKGTLEREVAAATGQAVKLPEKVTVTVHEETPESIHLVIPARMEPSAELDDAELARVSGGTGTVSLFCVMTAMGCQTATAC